MRLSLSRRARLSGPGSLAVALVAAGVAVASVAACGGDGGEDEGRVALTTSLGFLVEDFGLTEAQVRCVAEEVEAETGDAALTDLAEAVRAVDAGELTLADLPQGQGRVVTAAIETCAAVTG